MLKIGESALLLVRRKVSRNEINPPETKFLCGGACHCYMAKMYRIEGSAKKGNLHAVIESAFALRPSAWRRASCAPPSSCLFEWRQLSFWLADALARKSWH